MCYVIDCEKTTQTGVRASRRKNTIGSGANRQGPQQQHPSTPRIIVTTFPFSLVIPYSSHPVHHILLSTHITNTNAYTDGSIKIQKTMER
mmetsp:Transcript_4613/g.6027  ORF Transcript_4613/g.6027 Transcript_4613/m.6027 type:complete len:90 (+) Transcript_4613:874-1143(+)